MNYAYFRGAFAATQFVKCCAIFLPLSLSISHSLYLFFDLVFFSRIALQSRFNSRNCFACYLFNIAQSQYLFLYFPSILLVTLLQSISTERVPDTFLDSKRKRFECLVRYYDENGTFDRSTAFELPRCVTVNARQMPRGAQHDNGRTRLKI